MGASDRDELDEQRLGILLPHNIAVSESELSGAVARHPFHRRQVITPASLTGDHRARTPGVRQRRSRSPAWQSSDEPRHSLTISSCPLIGPDAPCPAVLSGAIRLAFLARADGLPLAVAKGPVACGTVQFSADGKRQPALQLTDSLIPQILKLVGLHWKIL